MLKAPACLWFLPGEHSESHQFQFQGGHSGAVLRWRKKPKFLLSDSKTVPHSELLCLLKSLIGVFSTCCLAGFFLLISFWVCKAVFGALSGVCLEAHFLNFNENAFLKMYITPPCRFCSNKPATVFSDFQPC